MENNGRAAFSESAVVPFATATSRKKNFHNDVEFPSSFPTFKSVGVTVHRMNIQLSDYSIFINFFFSGEWKNKEMFYLNDLVILSNRSRSDHTIVQNQVFTDPIQSIDTYQKRQILLTPPHEGTVYCLMLLSSAY